ncbi:MAG: DUF2914 domain-containing protein [Parcubacteria group bacterium]|nr:DUF2914 domain-containing protein [Parcubacteria group bacterium]
MLCAFRSHYQRVRVLYQRYERVLIPGFLVFGFFVDYITFKTIQISTSLTVLAYYFALAGGAIAFTHYYDAGRVTEKLRFVRLFAPLVIQYTFGALLGASFVFYWYSASFAASWPFILIVAGLMVGNEALRKYMVRPQVQLLAYYFIAFSFFSVAIPYLFNGLGPRLFLLAGLASLVFFIFYAWFVAAANKKASGTFSWVFGIFTVMNALYFANIIPPIPLSLRDAGAYHEVRRSNGGYILRTEHESVWQRLAPGQTVRLGPRERLYVYTSIFAPDDLRTSIYHQWHYYNESTGAWEKRDRLSFAITGGRREGYRGYSAKSAVDEGRWRVSVETDRGQVLGRATFTVQRVDAAPKLLEIAR